MSVPNSDNAKVSKKGIVPIEVARDIANDFFNMNSGGKMANKTVASEETLSENAQPFIYLFNYKNGGFLILSAEYGQIPILAYSDKNNFDTKQPINQGLGLWLRSMRDQIYLMRQDSLAPHEAASNLWQSYSNHSYQFESSANSFSTLTKNGQEVQLRDNYRDDTNNACSRYSWSRYLLNPLLQTEWSQGCGYNNLCPEFSTSTSCGRAPTGCVATAMAQVIRFHEFPTDRWNYSLMPSILWCWSGGSCATDESELAKLMHDSGRFLGMNYGAEASGANTNFITSTLVFFAYPNTMSYTSLSGPLRDSGIEGDLDARQPVILDGYNSYTSFLWFRQYREGHAWVCDGYDISTHPCYPSFKSYAMNWGWNGGGNGYYSVLAPRGVSQPYNFQYTMSKLTGIQHP